MYECLAACGHDNHVHLPLRRACVLQVARNPIKARGHPLHDIGASMHLHNIPTLLHTHVREHNYAFRHAFCLYTETRLCTHATQTDTNTQSHLDKTAACGE